MSDRYLTNGAYRYQFQGQEKDSETGKEAFELRLWDGRIGRWLTTDPYNQYHSPYLGMGNNPINGIDPDGGCFTTDKDGNTIPCPDMAVGSTMTSIEGYDWNMTENGWEIGAEGSYLTADLGTFYGPFKVDTNLGFLDFKNTYGSDALLELIDMILKEDSI